MPFNPNIHHRRSIRLKGYDYSKSGFYFITINIKDKICLFGKIVNGKMILNDAGRMVEKWYFELENKFPDKKCHEMVVMPDHFHCIIENIPVGADIRVCPNSPNKTQRSNPYEIPHNDRIIKSHIKTNDDEQSYNLETTMDNISVPGKNGNSDIYGNMDEHGVTFENVNTGEHGNSDENGIMDEHGTLGEHGILGKHGTLGKHGILGEHVGSPLHRAIQWFKTMSTNEYIRGVKQSGWKSFNGKLWQRNYWEHIIRDEKSYERISTYIINNPKNWTGNKKYK